LDKSLETKILFEISQIDKLPDTHKPLLDLCKIKIPDKYRDDIKKASILLKNEGCKAVYLFGSMVTGKTHQNSDIDIGITGLPAKKYFRVCADLDKVTTNKIDIVDFDLYSDFYKLLSSLGEVAEIG
jgi:predicted nucleotidyltransferase